LISLQPHFYFSLFTLPKAYTVGNSIPAIMEPLRHSAPSRQLDTSYQGVEYGDTDTAGDKALLEGKSRMPELASRIIYVICTLLTLLLRGNRN
jgi:hypothetical protein